MFKAALFMVVGILDRLTGTRDLRRLPALGREWWWIEVTALVAAATMAGVPLTAGFIAKEADFESFADARFGGHWPLLAVVVAGSVLTAAYSATFYWGAFVAPRRRARRRVGAGVDATGPPVRPPSWRFGAPGRAAGLGCLVLGVVPSIEDSLASVAVRALYAAATSVHFAIWHGVNLELVLSVAGARRRPPAVRALSTRRRAGARSTRLPLPVGERGYFGDAARR